MQEQSQVSDETTIGREMWMAVDELARLKVSSLAQLYRMPDCAEAIDAEEGPQRTHLMRVFLEGARRYWSGEEVPEYGEARLGGWLQGEFNELLPPMLVQAWGDASMIRKALVMAEFRGAVGIWFPEARRLLEDGFLRAGGKL